jgi:hypothetical protein
MLGDVDYSAEASASLMMYGLSSVSAATLRDKVIVLWKREDDRAFETVFVIGDRYGSLVQDILGKDLEEVGELRLVFAAPQSHRRDHISVGQLFYSSINSTLFVRMHKSSFEQANFEFVEHILSSSNVVKQWICLQSKTVNSSFLNRKLPQGVLRISSPVQNSFLASLSVFDELPQGFYLHGLSAACLNYSQTAQLAGTVLQFDVDKEDLLASANQLYAIVKAIGSTSGEQVSAELDMDVYRNWRKRVQVNDAGHLYM